MSKHACPRCGYVLSRSHWWDRHPALAVLFALPAGYTVIGVLLAYPWFFIPVLIVVCAVVVDRRQRHRHAIAARADWEHRALMVQSLPQLPATVVPRRRPASHWSITEPQRSVVSRFEVANLQIMR